MFTDTRQGCSLAACPGNWHARKHSLKRILQLILTIFELTSIEKQSPIFMIRPPGGGKALDHSQICTSSHDMADAQRHRHGAGILRPRQVQHQFESFLQP